ncbi:HD-GYP domain-containing protein [Thalassotalea agarivorans]|uniref:Putative two-component system response regulator n=1 Tax=Thalassotalea agarivorans TaxID=349064 RepID=A0A1I0FT79_THASX|nr:two-component system response regulator [Thalassotalea agarivorans]SET61594.1 putative two-component system response regulator [Thalassotalea agarivorans]
MSELQTILVVDDNPDNIDVLTGILRPYYKVKAAINGKLALKIASSKAKPDLILLDIMMPEIDGYQVCKELKANPVTRHIPVIFVTAKTEIEDEKQGFELGAVDYITKPVSMPIVLARIKTHLALYDQQRALEDQVKERTEQIEHTRAEIIKRLGRAAEYKDNETGMHVIRMSYYSKFLAQKIGCDDSWTELLFNAAPMHDIGKIGIPDAVLLKPGKLNDEEWVIMQKHVQYGADILGTDDSELLSLAREVALYHHEKWNGKGYPHGLSGEDIPLSARIVALADVFDALTSVRPYKEAWPIEKVEALFKEEAGQHFDPALVPEFLACMPQIKEIMSKYSDDKEAETFGLTE